MRSWLFLFGSRFRKFTITLIVTPPTHLRQKEHLPILKGGVPALQLQHPLAFLFFPLIVAPAELAVPPLGSLKVGQLAQSLRLRPYVLLRYQYFAINFCVEGELHLAVGRPSASFFAFTAVFLPAEQVPTWNTVFF